MSGIDLFCLAIIGYGCIAEPIQGPPPELRTYEVTECRKPRLQQKCPIGWRIASPEYCECETRESKDVHH